MLAERPDNDGREIASAVGMAVHEAAKGAIEGLLIPLNLTRSMHERWGMKGVLGALGITVIVTLPSFIFGGDIPRGTLLAASFLPAGGMIRRLERLAHGEYENDR